eukprot:15364474-Ditylum_brightwellii.AAC.2
MKFAFKPKYVFPIILDDLQHNALLAKPMHSTFFVQQKGVPQVDLDQSHQWLRHANLRYEAEVAICTTQDQLMATNYICNTLYKQTVNSLCHLCGKWNETILHISSGCDMLQGTKYTDCHNKNCTYLHWCILQDVQLPVLPNWHQHKVVKTPSICLEKGRTLMYNMTQQVDHAVATNHPDIVLLDEKKRTALLINVTCHIDVNIVTATVEKHKKYCTLEIAMKKQYKLCKIRTVPVLIGALGTLCQNFDTNLAKVSP